MTFERWIGLVGTALLAACSVGDGLGESASFGSDSVSPDDDGNDDDDGTTGNATGVSASATLSTSSPTATETATSTSDPSGDETDPVDESSTSGGSTTDDDTTGNVIPETSSSSTGTPIMCGDGVAEGDEDCDGDDLASMECADVGDFTGGTLTCDGSCVFDTSGCTTSSDPVEVCENVNVNIPDSGGGSITGTVTVPMGGNVADARVSVNLNHTFIGDLTIDVVHSGTTVRVYDRECFSEANMALRFDDAGGAINCAASTSNANTLPSQALSAFDGLAAGGDWDFTITDNAAVDTGTLLQMCVFVTF